ncbi:MAG TPA: XRE family transcriptional regulator [Spirochaetota bacterium]|nr:XRE family transcriptional regulator [Spirochaetota bacterium]
MISYQFGEKIREIREKRKITMREVAEKAGISESLISQIERNKVSPAIDTLLSIIDILEIDIEYIFSDLKKDKKVEIVRNSQRNKYIFEGVTYEQVSKINSENEAHSIEAYYLEIYQGKDKGSVEYGHVGKELGIILEGKGQLKYGNKVYDLEKGDSVSFSSDIPHILKNVGDGTLKAFWITTPPKMLVSRF